MADKPTEQQETYKITIINVGDQGVDSRREKILTREQYTKYCETHGLSPRYKDAE